MSPLDLSDNADARVRQLPSVAPTRGRRSSLRWPAWSLPVFLTLTLLPGLAAADASDDPFVWYNCDARSDRLVITYDREVPSAGEGVNPATLFVMRDDDHIGAIRTVRRACRLSDGVYHVEIWGAPGNANVQGECGGQFSAGVRIRRGKKILSTVKSLEPYCHDLDAPVVTRIEVSPGTDKAIQKQVPLNEFFR